MNIEEKEVSGKWLPNYSTGIFCIILVVAILLPLCILSFYNHPCGDDYFDSMLAINNGFWGAQKWWYFNWSGRYFASALLSANPLVYHVYWAYKLNAIVFLLLLVIATYWISGKLFENLENSGRIGITALFISVFIILMPNIGFAFFWQCSVYTILTPGILTIFLMGSMFGYYHSTHSKRYFILSCILAIVIIGSYEIHMAFIDFAILLIAFLSIREKRKLTFPLTLLAVCIVFSLIEMTAPGNTMRKLMVYPNAHNIVFAVRRSSVWDAYLLVHWLPFIPFMLFLLFDLLSKSKVWNNENSVYFISPVLCSLACLGIPFVGMFINFWATGIRPDKWFLNGVYFFFMIAMMYFSFSSMVRIKKRYPGLSIPGYIKAPVYLVIILLIVFIPNNINKAYRDVISGTAAAYNKERMERQEFLTEFKGDRCIVDSIKNIPLTLCTKELDRDTSTSDRWRPALNWLYDGYCSYYNKKYIGVKGK